MFTRFLQRFLAIAFIGTFVVLFVAGMFRVRRQNLEAGIQPVGPEPTSPTPTASPTSTTKVLATARATYTGSTYHIPWGDVAVSIVVQDNTLVAVDTPKFPDSPPSRYARPILIRQALEAGSSNIQGVSGATYTTLAFKRSLESALTAAHL